MTEGIVLDIATWSLIASLVIPLLVGVVTKEVASQGLKATLLALFSAANGVVSSAIQNEGLLTQATFTAAVVSFVVSVATYYGYLKPTGVAPAVAEKTSDVGIEKVPFT